MFTDGPGLEALRRMNTHKCTQCGKVFVNFEGMKEHMDENKHYTYELITETGEKLILSIG